MKCLVSGATGFIGRQLCQQLATRGDTVLALSKHGSPLADGQSTLALDLAHADPDLACFQGVDVCFHLAGIAHHRALKESYRPLNCDATLRLARMASAAGVRCFVFLSSVKAMGPAQTAEPRSENAVSTPSDEYGNSKWRAENALREEFASDRMSVVIVRPALVYGVNAKGNLQALARGVQKGLPRPPSGGKRSMIALQDLVELLCVISRQPPAGVTTWIASGAESYSTREIYDLLHTVGGIGSGIGWLPRWAWWAGAHLADLVFGRVGESRYQKLFGTELYSNASVLSATTWRPQFRLHDTIEQIARSGCNQP